jgi:maltose/moltooligosaccharide transporter
MTDSSVSPSLHTADSTASPFEAASSPTRMVSPLDADLIPEPSDTLGLPPYTVSQLFNLVIGLVGIQFAWSMQLSLSTQVMEPLGANPLIKGLIWCAGPLTGILVQPLIGSWSDKVWTPFGRRRPFIMAGALIAALALVAFPYSPNLWVVASFIWIIDACVNISQGPYRALVPDNVPPQQTTIANSYMNAAIAIGSVISLGVPPLLSALGSPMTIAQQFLMAAIALILTITYSCLTIHEHPPKPQPQRSEDQTVKAPNALKAFLASDPQVFVLCGVQFFTWLGVMCLFFNTTDFVVHNVFRLPTLTPELLSQVPSLKLIQQQALNTSQLGFAMFNLSSFLLTIPLAYLAGKIGRKAVHTFALGCMVLALACSPFVSQPWQVISMMGLAGIAWATILSVPFSILADYIPAGKEGSLMGVFNMFVASPQLISALAVGALVNHFRMPVPHGETNPYWLALVVGAASIVVAIILLQGIKEKPLKQGQTRVIAPAAGGH